MAGIGKGEERPEWQVPGQSPHAPLVKTTDVLAVFQRTSRLAVLLALQESSVSFSCPEDAFSHSAVTRWTNRSATDRLTP
jgi:hypothetical protein